MTPANPAWSNRISSPLARVVALTAISYTLLVPLVARADCPLGWQVVTTAAVSLSGGGVSLSDVSALSSDDVWIVGARPNSVAHQTLTEHWDGSAWTLVPSPRPTNLDNGLNAVDAIAPNDVWSVGYVRRPGGLFKALTLHWDGGAWNVVRARNAGVSHNTLTGVSTLSTDDVWAVGDWFNRTRYRPLTEHWDGDAWSILRAPPSGNGDAGLLSVAAISPTDVWTAGYATSTGEQPSALMAHWNGTAWSEFQLNGDASVVTGLSASSANDVWAVGYTYDGVSYHPFTSHWDGSSWSEIAVETPAGPFSFLRQVAEVSTTDVWAAGLAYDPALRDYVTLTEHWDGASWSIVPSPNGSSVGRKSNELIGLEAVPGSTQVWAVGAYGIRPLAMTTCGAPPKEPAPPTQSSNQADAPPARFAAGFPNARAPTRSAVRPGASVRPVVGHAFANGEPVTASDVAEATGIAETTRTWSAVAADFNSDGRSDLLIVRHQLPARLYLNTGGSFTEIDQGTIAPGDRHDCVAADLNVDGRVDFFCSVGAARGTRVKSDELWLEQPDLTFARAADSSRLLDPFGRGRRSTIVDANGDGAPDVFVGNQEFRPDGLPAPSRLFLNDGHGSFTDEPAYGLDQQTGSLCASADDFNGDGRQDLLICTGLLGLRLYRNDGSGFTDVTTASGLSGSPVDARLADVDGDGLPDLVEVLPTELRVLLQQPDGSFATAFTRSLSAGVWVATGDIDADGLPDLYVVQGVMKDENAPDLMLLNDGAGSFSDMPIPETSVGSGDVAVPIDYDGNGLTDFVVLNGALERATGPIQLIAFFPTAA